MSFLVPLDTSTTLDTFGHDPVWLVIIKAVLIFVILVLLTLFNIWWERRVVARMQHRIGPNVHGPFGLLQSEPITTTRNLAAIYHAPPPGPAPAH